MAVMCCAYAPVRLASGLKHFQKESFNICVNGYTQLIPAKLKVFDRIDRGALCL